MYVKWFLILTGGWLDLSVMADVFSTARMSSVGIFTLTSAVYETVFVYQACNLQFSVLKYCRKFLLLYYASWSVRFAVLSFLEICGGRLEVVINSFDDKNKFIFLLYVSSYVFLSKKNIAYFSFVTLSHSCCDTVQINSFVCDCVVLTAFATAACVVLMICSVH